ncbi:MAG: BsuBI/PstI family type II restriction endonuclease [Candidatus Binataceae bacterium]
MRRTSRARKTSEAREILSALGLPHKQQNEISALTLLALAKIRPSDDWSTAQKNSMRVSKDIMRFVRVNYGRNYAPNTRETFRRQVLHQFVQAGMCSYNPDNPDLAVNSPHAHYALTDPAIRAIRTYGTPHWKSAAQDFQNQKGVLLEIQRQPRLVRRARVRLPDGRIVRLSPGAHNRLQAAILESFARKFAPDAKLLYLGDAERKNLFVDQRALTELGIVLKEHGKLPDVLLYDSRRGWSFLVEAVTSHGPMSAKRVFELRQLFKDSRTGLVFVTAFTDFGEFRKHIREIAWETEVWIAEIPDHLIHYNGEKFFAPG